MMVADNLRVDNGEDIDFIIHKMSEKGYNQLLFYEINTFPS